MEYLIKLYRKLQKSKKCHRNILDNQLYARRVEKERPIDVKKESKENIIRSVASNLVAL